MNQNPKATRISIKEESADMMKPGDAALVTLSVAGAENEKPTKALVINCPWCNMPLATTKVHKITRHAGWIAAVCGYSGKISVEPMLQCPYVHGHSFKIKKGKIEPFK